MLGIAAMIPSGAIADRACGLGRTVAGTCEFRNPRGRSQRLANLLLTCVKGIKQDTNDLASVRELVINDPAQRIECLADIQSQRDVIDGICRIGDFGQIAVIFALANGAGDRLRMLPIPLPSAHARDVRLGRADSVTGTAIQFCQ